MNAKTFILVKNIYNNAFVDLPSFTLIKIIINNNISIDRKKVS